MAFTLQYRCQFGQNLSILGSSDYLGSWDVGQCVDMQWTENDIWKVEVELPSENLNRDIEYKYVVRNSSGDIDVWKPGENYLLHLAVEPDAPPETVRVIDAWDNSCREIEIGLRSASEAGDIVSTGQVATALTEAAEIALEELKSVVEASTAILDKVDPVSPEALMADQAVSSAASKALNLTKALNEYRATGQISKKSSISDLLDQKEKE